MRRIHARPTPRTRAELEAAFGRAWDTRQLAAEFIVTSIITPDAIVVRRKTDGVVGTLAVQNLPRLYFRFEPCPEPG
ncbi:MAG TPA: hypothetical protein VH092_30520 [Urbifossiella sp.]|jgi:hypothetical protein|nr:hypothetical protein [Urbifossiella sp.]